MEFYQANFAVFAVFNLILAYREYAKHIVIYSTKKVERRDEEDGGKEALSKFKRDFIPVYLLANGADWLQVRLALLDLIAATLTFQGTIHIPSIQRYKLSYHLLDNNSNTKSKDEKGLAEEVVAALFMTGFLSGAVSASFTGKLADQYGRRLACLSFCVLYSLSCLSLLTDDILILFLGRVLGGVSTTLMYSVFESWMVTEFNKKFPDEPGSTLSGIFSVMTTLNTIVAIFAGIVAEWVTDMVKTEKAPFMTAVMVLMTAFVAISKTWVGSTPNIPEKIL